MASRSSASRHCPESPRGSAHWPASAAANVSVELTPALPSTSAARAPLAPAPAPGLGLGQVRRARRFSRVKGDPPPVGVRVREQTKQNKTKSETARENSRIG